MKTQILVSPIDSPMEIQISTLFDLLSWSKRNVERWREALNNSLVVAVVLDDDDDVVGFARVVGDVYSATMFDLVVHPDYQRMGIGKMLIAELSRVLYEMGAQHMYCLADNPTSGGYYSHGGWRQIFGFVIDL